VAAAFAVIRVAGRLAFSQRRRSASRDPLDARALAHLALTLALTAAEWLRGHVLTGFRGTRSAMRSPAR